MSPGRLDHWISLAEHLRRYANIRPQPSASHNNDNIRNKTKNPTRKKTQQNEDRGNRLCDKEEEKEDVVNDGGGEGSKDSKGSKGGSVTGTDVMARGWEFGLWWWTYVMERRFSVGIGGRSSGTLSVADVIDIAAHFKTATRVLNPLEVIAATAAAEAARRCLRLDLVSHHRHGWSDVRRVMTSKK